MKYDFARSKFREFVAVLGMQKSCEIFKISMSTGYQIKDNDSYDMGPVNERKIITVIARLGQGELSRERLESVYNNLELGTLQYKGTRDSFANPRPLRERMHKL